MKSNHGRKVTIRNMDFHLAMCARDDFNSEMLIPQSKSVSIERK